jgi:starch synthase
VRGTGGLLDTVVDYNSSRQKSNGFVFYEFLKVSFLDALVRALSVYEKKEEWKKLVIRAMKEDFSWKRSSELYLDLYKGLKNTG